jgi:hypothetical protein
MVVTPVRLAQSLAVWALTLTVVIKMPSVRRKLADWPARRQLEIVLCFMDVLSLNIAFLLSLVLDNHFSSSRHSGRSGPPQSALGYSWITAYPDTTFSESRFGVALSLPQNPTSGYADQPSTTAV